MAHFWLRAVKFTTWQWPAYPIFYGKGTEPEWHLNVPETLSVIVPVLNACTEAKVIIQWSLWVTKCRESPSWPLNVSLVLFLEQQGDRGGRESAAPRSFWTEESKAAAGSPAAGGDLETVVVCSAHYAQFFPVSCLSISLGSTRIT